MKALKLTLISLILLTGSVNVVAQHIGRIENGFNLESFPEVSFIYHSYNPDILDVSHFWHLKESGINRDFEVEHLSADDSNQPQTTLILWEDMAHNGTGQYNFTKKVLSGFFSKANIPMSDRFALASFNRRKNTTSLLTELTDGFTSDKSQITEAVNNYQRSTEYYKEYPNRSDLYTAIREGLELLAPVKGVKSIIVFTAGYSMKNSGADSESQVLLKAQQLHIPVYIIQYYYKSGVAPESEGFAKSTFGSFNSYMDVATAETDLIKLYPEIAKRYQGHRYEIAFVSEGKRGSESRMINLSVDGQDIQEQLLPPPYTLLTWIKDYPWWFALILVAFVSVVVLAIIFIRKSHAKTLENQKNLEALEQRRLQDKEIAEQRQRDIENKNRKKQDEVEQQAEIDRLSHLMRVKNIYPRLRCQVGSETFMYEIQQPHTSIGRNPDNDIVLNDDKVSRYHAEIVFTGVGFNIIDKGSTNKVILNGQFVKQAPLKSGDIIGLGEVVIIFM